jgi:hypothetical protein
VVLARDAGEPSSWTPDGEQLLIARRSERGDYDVWIALLEGSKATLQPLVQTSDADYYPELSPDGRWLAFVSGRFELYVQPFPGPGPRTLVSVSGGGHPAWNPNGKELFFVGPPDPAQPWVRRMMVVDVRTRPALRLGVPRPLFEFSSRDLPITCYPARCYDVSSDGQRFFGTQVVPSPRPPPVTHIHLVQNWLEELKARVPTD